MSIQSILLLRRDLPICVLAGSALLWATAAWSGGDSDGDDDEDEIELEEARIFFEYNSSGNDLGVHVFLDGEDWTRMRITNPDDKKIFEVTGKGPYKELGMTELFFEGAEPTLDEVPLEELLDMFPEGEYEFEGKTTDGEEIEGEGEFSHAIPAGPEVFSSVGSGNSLIISWTLVTGPPDGFPDLPINIVGYQIIVGSFQVTLPGTATSVTVPPEFVASLDSGVHDFEVLAIEESGNQSITEGVFTLP